MGFRRPFALVAIASFATGASALGGGCSYDAERGDTASGAMNAHGDASVESAVAPPPRRVCPSDRNPDGSWLTVDGLDISDYKVTDWDRVVRENPSHKFAFARISAGLVRVDTRFAFDWPEMKRVGLIRGVYQYFKPSQSATAQAELFLRRLREEGGLEPTDFPPVLDLETTNDMPPATIQCRVEKWLAHVERATGRVPIIYSSVQHNAILPARLSRYPLWVANYVGTPSVTCPRMPDTWAKWKIWQYSESATVKGVYANADRDNDAGGVIALQDGGDGGPVWTGVDVNFFDGTLADLKTFVASTISTGEVPDPPPLADPPHVPGASPDAGGPVDCADGCCVAVP